MADTTIPTSPEPGFYLKFSVCNEHGEELVQSKPIRILTASEFYEQRMIAANVAQTYIYFAKFAGKASEGVTLIDALTAFSRSNCPPRRPPLPYYAITDIATQAIDTLESVVTALKASEDSKFAEALENAISTDTRINLRSENS
jgi:hypothetical protein